MEIKDNGHFWKIVEYEITGEKYTDGLEEGPASDEKKYFSEYFAKMFIPRFEGTKQEFRIRYEEHLIILLASDYIATIKIAKQSLLVIHLMLQGEFYHRYSRAPLIDMLIHGRGNHIERMQVTPYLFL